jgi:hypothetical protein
VQTPGREEVGEVHLEPLVSSPRLAWEQPLGPTRAGGFGFGGSSGGGGFGFFRDQNQNLTGAAATPSQQQMLQLDSKNGSNSSTSDYLIWKALDATKYQR